ncbi:MAG: AAA domain-containing protein [Candidatus Lokiarchaeota archaeon]|nr:AAA domain-containing protein [Candidatus Lokiarchaeota archaeon]MBD3338896.1 AAA domain-containing protein [Candidatus Lokiarchaeota archaeon]
MVNTVEIIKKIQTNNQIIGRENELKKIILARSVGKNILIEGEVGVGKTTIAKAVSAYYDTDFYRVDCTEDTLTHNLVGYFDPPLVIAKGYVEESYKYGPLASAMDDGGCLFINEINRMPESTQNALLTALDEKILDIPKLRTIKAEKDFFVIATLNPSAHVGVTALGEAIKDRFVWIKLDYQEPAEEVEIILQNVENTDPKMEQIAEIAQAIIQKTRDSSSFRRGSSVRGAIDLTALMSQYNNNHSSKNWVEAAIMSLYNKIEIEDGISKSKTELIVDIVLSVLNKSDFQ